MALEPNLCVQRHSLGTIDTCARATFKIQHTHQKWGQFISVPFPVYQSRAVDNRSTNHFLVRDAEPVDVLLPHHSYLSHCPFWFKSRSDYGTVRAPPLFSS